jgi:pilin isopeptide linkage protein
MKKMKRILALALTSVMALSLLAPAASATDNGTTDTNSPKTALEFEKKYWIDSDVVIPTEGATFTFSMEPLTPDAGTKISGTEVQEGVALTTNETSVTFTEADMEDTTKFKTDADTGKTYLDATLSFDLTSSNVTFTEVGIYRYLVKEVMPSKKNSFISYDETQYRVDLYVTKSGDDYVVSSIVSMVLGNSSKEPIIFENSYVAGTATISKVITGDGLTAADQTKEFQFFIKIPEGGDNLTLSSSDSITAKIHRNNNTVEEVSIQVGGSKDDKVEVTATEDGFTSGTTGAYGFTLAGGEYMTLENVPVGMIFWVTEADYRTSGYTTTASFVGTGDYATSGDYTHYDNGLWAKGTVAGDTSTLTFTNEKNLEPETGVNVDFAPYLLVLMVAVIGGAAVLVFKKRNTIR